MAMTSPRPNRMSVGQTRSAMTSATGLAAVLVRVAEVALRVADDVRDELVRDERLVEAPALRRVCSKTSWLTPGLRSAPAPASPASAGTG